MSMKATIAEVERWGYRVIPVEDYLPRSARLCFYVMWFCWGLVAALLTR